MNIYTSYFSNYKNLAEYQCISIANTKPLSITIPEYDLVKPDWVLVTMYRDNVISFEEFEHYYTSKLELLGKTQIESYLNHFNQTSLVILCWEKDPTKCHRTIFANFVSNVCDSIYYKGEL